MVTKESIRNFMNCKSFAVVGVSQNKQKFGNALYKELKSKGLKVFPVNFKSGIIEGDKCFSDLKSLPEKVEAVIINVKPNSSLVAIMQAEELSIKNIWLQKGAESPEAIDYCKRKDINLIHGYCAIMFLEPLAFPHKIHRGLIKLFGKYPK